MCVASSASSSRVPGASRAAGRVPVRAPLLALDGDATCELRGLLDRVGASMAAA